MGVRVDAGRYPNKNILYFLVFRGNAVQQYQLVEVVDHHPSATLGYRLCQLLLGFVVTVEIYPFSGETAIKRHGKLPARNHVQAQAFLV